MGTINIGWNGDPELLPKLAELNKRPDIINKIRKVYGSIKKHAFLSARPEFRLPNMELINLKGVIDFAHLNGIEFNYTLNAPYIGSKAELNELIPKISGTLDDLKYCGVDRLIISSPMLFEIIHRLGRGKEFKFEVSTIAHIDTVMQIQALHSMYPNIDTVCGNLLKNRDFDFLTEAVNLCDRLGITYEILSNEFCSTGFKSGGTHCVFRDSCYMCHSSNVTKEDATSYYNYPMGNCMASRSQNGADWLRSSFVLPQDIPKYEDYGISQFKVTGRTGTTEYVMFMAEVYGKGHFSGNLLELWKPLETIYREGSTESGHKHKFNIPADSLRNFIDPWIDGRVECIKTLCDDCRYCDEVYERTQIALSQKD